MRPWEYHPDLSSERLIKVAQLLASGRGQAVDRHEPSIGCDAWTLGIEAFNFGRFQISRAAGTPGLEWLDVPDASRRLLFRIGSVPLRFYRGFASEPTARTMTDIPIELEQYPLPLEDGASLDGCKFRLAVETNEDGTVMQISFVAVRGGLVETIWPIPYENAKPLIVALDDHKPEGRELLAPVVEFPLNGEEEAESGFSESK